MNSQTVLQSRNNRRTFIGGSDARIIMGGDEAALLRLWREKRGEAALLLRLLERRFGVLPGWARDRVLAADTSVLEEWGLRVLDAATLEEVFA